MENVNKYSIILQSLTTNSFKLMKDTAKHTNFSSREQSLSCNTSSFSEYGFTHGCSNPINSSSFRSYKNNCFNPASIPWRTWEGNISVRPKHLCTRRCSKLGTLRMKSKGKVSFSLSKSSNHRRRIFNFPRRSLGNCASLNKIMFCSLSDNAFSLGTT